MMKKNLMALWTGIHGQIKSTGTTLFDDVFRCLGLVASKKAGILVINAIKIKIKLDPDHHKFRSGLGAINELKQ